MSVEGSEVEPGLEEVDETAREALFRRALHGDEHARDFFVRQACAGVPGAHGFLVRIIDPILQEIAKAMLRGKRQASYSPSDLKQSVIAKALPRLRQLRIRNTDGLLAFLRKACENKVKDRAKRARERHVHQPLDPQVCVAAREDSMMERSERLESFRRRTAGLPEPCREIVWLRVVVELDFAAIAAELGEPSTPESVRKRFGRCLERLRRSQPRES